MANRTADIRSPQGALLKLADLVSKSMLKPNVREAAMLIVSDCPGRNNSGLSAAEIDKCELEAIYDAVKSGTDKVPGLKRGVRYVADPRGSDYFIAPHRLLEMCRSGACSEDCDSQAALVSSLAGALGFKVGLRAWAKPGSPQFTHVYSVVKWPKVPPKRALNGFGDGSKQETVAMDTTVHKARPGWEPAGRHMDVWLK